MKLRDIVKILIFLIICYSIYNLFTYNNDDKAIVEKMSPIDKAHQVVSENAHNFSTMIKQLKTACKAVKIDCGSMNFHVMKGL